MWITNKILEQIRFFFFNFPLLKNKLNFGMADGCQFSPLIPGCSIFLSVENNKLYSEQLRTV